MGITDGLGSEATAIYQEIIRPHPLRRRLDALLRSRESLDPCLRRLFETEAALGGVGAHNGVLLVDRDSFGRGSCRGNYHADDRDIFRPLLYTTIKLLSNFVDLSPSSRYIISNSGLHVENLLERVVRRHGAKPGLVAPLGGILRELEKVPRFALHRNGQLLDDTRTLNAVIRMGKHEIEFLRLRRGESLEDVWGDSIDDHTFSGQESFVTYLGCRIVGMGIMEWMGLHGMRPKTLEALPPGEWTEYEALADQCTWELRRFDPDLVRMGRRWVEREEE